MKNLSLLCFILGMLLISCQKESDELTGDRNPIDLSGLPAILKDSVEIAEDGALRFLSSSAYFSIVDSLQQLSEKDLDRWEKGIGFYSMRRSVRDILTKNANIASKEEIKALVNRYPHLITIRERGIEPLVELAFYRMILNESACFYVQDIRHEISGNNLNVYYNQKVTTRSSPPDQSFIYLSERIQTRTPNDEVKYVGPEAGHWYEYLPGFVGYTYIYPCIETSYKYFRNLVSSGVSRDPATNQPVYVCSWNYRLELNIHSWKYNSNSYTWSDLKASSLYFKSIQFRIENNAQKTYDRITSTENVASFTKILSYDGLIQTGTPTPSDCDMYRIQKLYYQACSGDYPYALPVYIDYTYNTAPNAPTISGPREVLAGTDQTYSVPSGYAEYEWSIPSGCTVRYENGRSKAVIKFPANGEYRIGCRVKRLYDFSPWAYLAVTTSAISLPEFSGRTQIATTEMNNSFLYTITNHETTNYTSYEWSIPAGIEKFFPNGDTKIVSLQYPTEGLYIIKVRGLKNGYTSPWVEKTIETGLTPPDAPVISGPSFFHNEPQTYTVTNLEEGDVVLWWFTHPPGIVNAYKRGNEYILDGANCYGEVKMYAQIKRGEIASATSEKTVYLLGRPQVLLSWGEAEYIQPENNPDYTFDNTRREGRVFGYSNCRTLTVEYDGNLAYNGNSPHALEIYDPSLKGIAYWSYITTIYSENTSSPFIFKIPEEIKTAYKFRFPALLSENQSGEDALSKITVTAQGNSTTFSREVSIKQQAPAELFFSLEWINEYDDFEYEWESSCYFASCGSAYSEGYLTGTSNATTISIGYSGNVSYGEQGIHGLEIYDAHGRLLECLSARTTDTSYEFDIPYGGNVPYKFLFPIYIAPNRTGEEVVSEVYFMAGHGYDNMKEVVLFVTQQP